MIFVSVTNQKTIREAPHGRDSKIEWTDHTFNPWMGCTKVSPACKHCYAERDMDHRFSKVAWGSNGTRKKTVDWSKPRKWNREASGLNRTRVFCASLADVFEDWQGSVEGFDGSLHDLRVQLFELIDETPNLDWLLLTKRPENIKRFWIGDERENVWLGTSAENQQCWSERIPQLHACRGLVPVLFASCEPLLSEIEIDSRIDWLIAGGESGPNARPSNPDWFRSLRDQCNAYGVAFHFKQWGEYGPSGTRVGKKAAGRMLDGHLHEACPGPKNTQQGLGV